MACDGSTALSVASTLWRDLRKRFLYKARRPTAAERNTLTESQDAEKLMNDLGSVMESAHAETCC